MKITRKNGSDVIRPKGAAHYTSSSSSSKMPPSFDPKAENGTPNKSDGENDPYDEPQIVLQDSENEEVITSGSSDLIIDGRRMKSTL